MKELKNKEELKKIIANNENILYDDVPYLLADEFIFMYREADETFYLVSKKTDDVINFCETIVINEKRYIKSFDKDFLELLK